MKAKDLKVLDNLLTRTDELPEILHLRAAPAGYQQTTEDKALLLDTYSKLDDILKELAAFINIKFPGCERHVRAWNEIDFDTKIGDMKIITTDREHTKREWRKGLFDLKSLIKVLKNETILLIDEDEVGLTGRDLTAISNNYALEHFKDKKVIPNQELVNETISFFETGPGKGTFTPLAFLNLFDQQYEFVKLNFNDPDLVMRHFESLALSDSEKHTLFGFILKWFGGYPVNNMNDELNFTLKLVQTAFLNFPGDTPEKQYCKTDQAMRNKFEKYGIAFTAAINHGLDVNELLAAMEPEDPAEKVFHQFSDLFAAATANGLVGPFPGQKHFLIAQTTCNYEFNIWLQTHKDWEYRNEEQYLALLTIPVFSAYLSYKAAKNNLALPVNSAPLIAISTSPKPTIKQIALICHYTDRAVTRTNAQMIVSEYQHTSGDALFNQYSRYRSKANRTGAENSKKKNSNKIELFESISPYLTANESALKKAEADIISLKAAIETANLNL
jgi:hypothetical protein